MDREITKIIHLTLTADLESQGLTLKVKVNVTFIWPSL